MAPGLYNPFLCVLIGAANILHKNAENSKDICKDNFTRLRLFTLLSNHSNLSEFFHVDEFAKTTNHLKPVVGIPVDLYSADFSNFSMDAYNPDYEPIYIEGSENIPSTFELSISDLIFTENFICHAHFYTYRIDGESLVEPLKLWSQEYFEVCMRFAPHERQVYQLERPEQPGFPFYIQDCTELTLSDVIPQLAQPKGPLKRFPAYVELPFFMEAIDVDDMRSGRAPVLKVKLVNYSDGCSISFTMSHAVADEFRVLMALQDFAKAVRGEPIEPKEHDRKHLWPDEYKKRINIVCIRPPTRVFSRNYTVRAYDSHDMPGNTELACEMLLFPNASLERWLLRLKEITQDEVEFTRNQLIMAWMWMIRTQMAKDCEIDWNDILNKSKAVVFLDPVNGIPGVDVFPKNYFGNAFVGRYISYKEHDMASEALEDHERCLLNACFAVKDVYTLDLMEVGFNLYQMYMLATEQTLHSSFSLDTVCVTCPLPEYDNNNLDLGSGGPVFSLIPPALPVFDFCSEIRHVPEGAYVTCTVTDSTKKRLYNSTVLEKFDVGARFVFGGSLTESQLT